MLAVRPVRPESKDLSWAHDRCVAYGLSRILGNEASGHTEETVMHPSIYREFVVAREAELRRRVELDRRVNAVISHQRRWRFSRVRWGGWRRPPRPAVERSTEMAKFMDVHRGFTGVTEDQLHAAHQRDLDVEAAEGVHFERAWLDPESGTVFCLSTGPSKEAVQRVHEKAGHPPDEVYELPVEA